MSKQEFNDWIEDLKSQGYDDAEIDAIIEDYLNQPESPEWYFNED